MLRTKSSQAWYLFSNQVMQVNYLREILMPS